MTENKHTKNTGTGGMRSRANQAVKSGRAGAGTQNSRSSAGAAQKGGASAAEKSREYRALQNKRKRIRLAKKRRAMFLGIVGIVALAVIILLVVLLKSIFSGKADRDTLTLNEDGSIVFEEVSDYSQVSYSKSELKSYIKDAISEYNEAVDEKAVKLEKLSVSGDEVYLRIWYEDAETYQDFTGYTTFSGTIEEALSAGYDFAASFVEVSEEALGDSVDTEDITEKSSLSLLILQENCVVNIEGATISYVTVDGATLLDENSVEFTSEDEDVASTSYVIYTVE